MAFKRDSVLASAEKLLARGKYDGALKEYLRILDENPNDILVLNKVGDLYVTINRPMDSIPFFTRIAEHYSKDGFFLKAIAIYKKINKLDPSRLDVYTLLADLYHKQGLVPEARAQYQVLADYYQKQNQLLDAIGVYKKMAAADPNDIKIPVKLADLLTGAGRTDEALMEYGVIGSMLVKRGAVDEAVAVYQKALKIRPGDLKIVRDLVRSLIENGNAPAAVQLLKNQPRGAETMALLAEALLATGALDEARRAAEGAIAFEDGHEEARQLLCKILLSQRDSAKAYEVVRPAVDKAVRSGEVKKAIGMIAGFLQFSPAVRPAFDKLLELYGMAGDREGSIQVLRAMAHEAEARKDNSAAAEAYRRWLELEPENSEARSRAGAIAPDLTAPVHPSGGAGPMAAPAAPADAVDEDLVLEIDDSAISQPPPTVRPPAPASSLSLDWDVEFGPSPPSAAPGAPARPAETPPRPRLTPVEDFEWKNALTEAEVFAKYGLLEKAAEKYRALVKKRREDLTLRSRYIELLAESKSPLVAQEAVALEEDFRTAGKTAEADAIRARYLAPLMPRRPGAPSAPQVPLPEPPVPPAARPTSPRATVIAPVAPEQAPETPAAPLMPEPVPSALVEFDDFGSVSLPGPPVPVEPPTEPEPPTVPAVPPTPPSVAPVDLEFTADADLGKAIEDEMAKFQAVTPPEAPKSAAPIDEMALFSDEQSFFNLAAELEKELAEEETAPTAPLLETSGGEASLEQIFREFKKGVEQQLSPEDYETHYNLGIAYKEMGLLDEAIGEFQIASKDPSRSVECCSMLGLCFLEKGLPQLAMQWYSKGLENPAIKEAERLGLQYDLASIYEQTGEAERAYQLFLSIYGQNTNYRDIVHRVKSLEGSRQS
jgi:tetratricopeptide (TPR) repeat protein